ncbi:hypothetical protein [Vibrio anguillarum]|uniref:Uncharacterized protein n=1 Tax=Vibrio anguillarum TaxID=55601 RepID=A0ABR9Z8N0_VIBAN|nr:hypothetical protein [Vibrio anguillarum]MBF4374454.1 hypothetical protein [Vibrio anguillarum]
MPIEQFPIKPKNIRGKSQLAWWLRELADLVEQDLLGVEPYAALLIFVGENGSELLHVGGLSSIEKRAAIIKALSEI